MTLEEFAQNYYQIKKLEKYQLDFLKKFRSCRWAISCPMGTGKTLFRKEFRKLLKRKEPS